MVWFAQLQSAFFPYWKCLASFPFCSTTTMYNYLSWQHQYYLYHPTNYLIASIYSSISIRPVALFYPALFWRDLVLALDQMCFICWCCKQLGMGCVFHYEGISAFTITAQDGFGSLVVGSLFRQSTDEMRKMNEMSLHIKTTFFSLVLLLR